MKKRILLLIAFLVSVAFIFITYAVVDTTGRWESGKNITILKSGYNMTLQEGIDHNVYLYRATRSYTRTLRTPGHGGLQVWVSVNGYESTLYQALFFPDGLCGNTPTTSYTSAPESGAYHYANEISISINGAGTMSLQDAIDNGFLCYYDQYTFSWYTSSWGSCVHDPLSYDLTKCIQTRMVYCRTNKNVIISDNDPQRFCRQSKPAESRSCSCSAF
ncbi:MAG: hypothetical protein M1416_00210 [Candidatus Pacearchaeota archaeon]|nr:hypothetical protein [Candidatus Pacearchaeota archaeon]